MNVAPSLFLLSSLTIGGSETKTIRLVNQLAAAGWPVHLAYLNAPTTQADRVDAQVPLLHLHRRGKFSARALANLRGHVRTNGIRTIVAVNLYPSLYAAGVAVVHHRTTLRHLIAVNTTDLLTFKDRLQLGVYGPVMRRAGGIVFGCTAQKDAWVERYQLAAERCTVIYNGVDAGHFSVGDPASARREARAALGLEPTDFVIGTVGQLRPEKAQASLVAVALALHERIPNLKCLIVGEGPERGRLEQLIRAKNASSIVRLPGQMNDVRPAIAAMDLFALPSVAVETFSNAALEAMSMATPVVLSDVGGAREMVSDKTSGLVYPRGDEDALAQAIARLHADSSLRAELGRAARAEVERRFAFSRMVEAYERLLADQPEGSDRCAA